MVVKFYFYFAITGALLLRRSFYEALCHGYKYHSDLKFTHRHRPSMCIRADDSSDRRIPAAEISESLFGQTATSREGWIYLAEWCTKPGFVADIHSLADELLSDKYLGQLHGVICDEMEHWMTKQESLIYSQGNLLDAYKNGDDDDFQCSWKDFAEKARDACSLYQQLSLMLQLHSTIVDQCLETDIFKEKSLAFKRELRRHILQHLVVHARVLLVTIKQTKVTNLGLKLYENHLHRRMLDPLRSQTSLEADIQYFQALSDQLTDDSEEDWISQVLLNVCISVCKIRFGILIDDILTSIL